MEARMKIRYVITFFSVILIVYFALGLAFHVRWSNELVKCNEVLREQGEFVEPEMFRSATGFIFNVTFWPVYSAANIYHDGTTFATPCTHS
jgi:hypothetical protein